MVTQPTPQQWTTSGFEPAWELRLGIRHTRQRMLGAIAVMVDTLPECTGEPCRTHSHNPWHESRNLNQEHKGAPRYDEPIGGRTRACRNR